ncbi:MAG: hypothetical protein IJ287_01900 [Methanobrevibacter sp.]|nr:hypothetical protein [Methanobrevibacter sp.]
MSANKKNIAEYGHFKKVNDPKIIEEISKIDLNYEMFPSEEYYKICELLEINIEY